MRNNKGVTLVELLVVIVVMGIIAGFAIPAVGNIITNANKDAVLNDALQIENAARLYCSSSSDDAFCETGTLANLQTPGTAAANELTGYIDGVDFATDYTFAAVQLGADGEWYVYLEATAYYFGAVQAVDLAGITEGIIPTAGVQEGLVPSDASRTNIDDVS